MKISLGSISSLAIFSAVKSLPTSLIARQVETCPINALSCTPDAGGSCCSPANSRVVLVQGWYQGLGPADSFTMNSLRASHCDGRRTRWGCDPSRNYPNLDSILSVNQTLYDEMRTYWPSVNGPDRNDEFWSHEWENQGTCITTLEPKCFSNYTQYQDVYTYFGTALQLHQQHDLFAMLSNSNITPGGSYSLDVFEEAIRSYTGFTPKITCNQGSVLNEIMIYFNVRNGDQYEPTDSTEHSFCRRQSMIHFPVK
ncbi:ribonuclease T2-like protein [Absidia repens]|uniref:Ribonuclease T2-like protein n=1 Tax=Absidia repens TaxID=90262 RepID=A0A1X2I1I0_9FUNG|nr:ribonuclease T2-like protein [Absidia repens]